MQEFPLSAPSANPVFYRTYSRRKDDGSRESYQEVCDRTVSGLWSLGNLTSDEVELVANMQSEQKCLPSGRWLWVGGTEYVERPENYNSAYNCSSTLVDSWEAFGYIMELAMMGVGTGAVLENWVVEKLPTIKNSLSVNVVGEFGGVPKGHRHEHTSLAGVDDESGHRVTITVGDSRKGWVDSYQLLLELASDEGEDHEDHIDVTVDISHVRPAGEPLKGFGGTANPIKLAEMFFKVANILNKAKRRKLTPIECCLIIDEAAVVVVAGNVRRSAGIRQFSASDAEAAEAKAGLYKQDDEGYWVVDTEREALRMANHTRVFHQKPSLDECLAAVQKQYYSGEGAIQWAGEAVARANTDLWKSEQTKADFLYLYDTDKNGAMWFLKKAYAQRYQQPIPEGETEDRMTRYGLNPCFAPGTLIHVLGNDDGNPKERAVPIEELVGQSVTVYDGGTWIECNNFRVTGENKEVFTITTSDGDTITATAYHRFWLFQSSNPRTLKQLNVGDRLERAWPIADNGTQRWYSEIAKIEPAGVSEKVYCCTIPSTSKITLANGIVTGNCGEIIMRDNFCNLGETHLNQLDPHDLDAQESAFKANGIIIAALLHHEFTQPRYQSSREIDPIVGASFTGLFDFFVELFGADWLRWWEAGRPTDWDDEQLHHIGGMELVSLAIAILERCPSIDDCDTPALIESTEATWGTIYKAIEELYLKWWSKVVHETVWDYCDRHGLKRPNRCTTVQPAGCLDRTALRVFDQGLIYADEVVDPGSGETTGLPYSVRGGVGATTAIANQKLPVVKVTLHNGRVLKMTHNHRLSVEGKWVQACDMKPGMKIDYSIGEYTRTTEANLLPINEDVYTREYRQKTVGHSRGVLAKTVKTPTAMSWKLAYFLGAMFGNGCLSPHKYRVRFCHGRVDILTRIKNIGDELFGVEGVLAEDSRGGKHELTYTSRQLYDWIQLNQLDKGGKSKELDRIPYTVRTSSRDSILAFFAGLIDTDGCPRKNGTFSIDMASEAFIRNLQQVGEAVGLCFNISHNTKGQNFQWQKNIWTVGLSKQLSQWESCDRLNQLSVKLWERPIAKAQRFFKFNPFKVKLVEFGEIDYTYDFAVEGVDDNDSWYWQGAIKSHNTKSLLTGASSGWHPPKAQRFIRRITFGKNDPVALACRDYGYSIVPAPGDKDEGGRLLDDPMDTRCTEWLVEIPTEVSWANLPGADTVDISQFSALAQFDFYMQVQKHYTTHNASGTLEMRESDIEPLGNAIHQAIINDEGYISCAILARFDDHQTFPRLPFEPIDKPTYDRLQQEVLSRRKNDDFLSLLAQYDAGHEYSSSEQGPMACDSDKCLLG